MAHPKGLLIERAQKLGLERPEFNTVKTGPEHEPSFLSDVTLDGEVLGTGQGGSKKDAERAAAEEALAALERRGDNSGSSGSGGNGSGGRQGSSSRGSGRGPRSAASGSARAAAQPVAETEDDEDEDEEYADDDQAYAPGDADFGGPWPMFDDLLASVLEVAERRIPSHLHGEDARAAIRDFSLTLYKELLSDLGEVVDEDEDDEEEDD